MKLSPHIIQLSHPSSYCGGKFHPDIQTCSPNGGVTKKPFLALNTFLGEFLSYTLQLQ